MKSSKYTQANSPNDNDYYQNIGTTVLPQNEHNLNQNVGGIMYAEIQHHNVSGTKSDELLIAGPFETSSYVQGENVYKLQQSCNSPERNANTNVHMKYGGQEFELVCNCALTDTLFPVPKFRYNSEQNITFCPKLDNSTSQCSLDRKVVQPKQKQKHNFICEPKTNRNTASKRIQSPEIINIHRGHSNVLYDTYDPENCTIKSYGYDKDLKCDDYGFRREQSFKRGSVRSVYK